MLKDPPVTEAEFTIIGDVPVELSVNDWVAVELTFTLPKLRAEALNVNCGCCRPDFGDALMADGTNASEQMNARRSAPRRPLSHANFFSGQDRFRDFVGELLVDVDTT